MQITLLKKSTIAAAAIAAGMMAAGGASAATIDLDDIGHCDGTSNTNTFTQGGGPNQTTTSVTINVTDVTGNLSGASDCWGAAQGNDSQLTGTATDGSSNFETGGMLYSFVSKVDINTNDNDVYTGQSTTGVDIGLQIGPSGGLPSSSGTWSVDAAKFAPYGDFLISLKAANNPGYAVWLFSGSDAESTSGDWEVAWGNNLSHLSIYAKDATDISTIPLPAAGWLLLAGIGGLAAFRRHKSV